jgi:hypothetical protein
MVTDERPPGAGQDDRVGTLDRPGGRSCPPAITPDEPRRKPRRRRFTPRHKRGGQFRCDEVTKQASPWANAPALAPQPEPFDHRGYLVNGRIDVELRIMRQHVPGLAAAYTRTAPQQQCVCCARPYVAGTGMFALVVRYGDRSSGGAAWICDQCGQMDDQTLLDACLKNFSDEVEHAREREGTR